MTAPSDSQESTARPSIRDGIDDARAKASEAAHTAIERTKDGLEQARGVVADAYETGREKAAEALAATRERAKAASKTAADGLDSNPIAALLGGIAVGVVIGAMLPRTEREAQALGVVGDKLQGAAREAADAAKEAGRDKLAELGLSRDQARETVKTLIDHVIAAAGTAGAAAFESARKSSK
jgi:ElaB/YqjD/DUF883 family membrane-anchored ribosome-binding protein